MRNNVAEDDVQTDFQTPGSKPAGAGIEGKSCARDCQPATRLTRAQGCWHGNSEQREINAGLHSSSMTWMKS